MIVNVDFHSLVAPVSSSGDLAVTERIVLNLL